MSLHQVSGRWKRGLLLALVTAGCWATLPVVLKITLEQIDPYTLTWFRFLFAAGVMGAWLAARRGLGGFATLDGKRWWLLGVAAACLIGNYLFYLLGVQLTSPGNAQLLIQLAPLLMALGGIVVFREAFNRWQWLGLAILATGLLLFFRDQLGVPRAAEDAPARAAYLLGSGLVILAAVVWAIFALVQKQLLVRLSSPAIMLFIYAVASGVLLPVARPGALLQLDLLHAGLLLFCALNTLVAYGAFAEALAHWEASRVSTVLAVTPLLCVGVVALVHAIWPAAIRPEAIGATGYVGAGLVVLGSAVASLMGARRR
ncbi:DMT family transporter [Arenimonas sp. MALMAid1274]|uniref:DMT family transporter n=1 Tax=Arenimonas sp. MALMAid1274 TaxID=3411630 RepID=UPI003BA0330A